MKNQVVISTKWIQSLEIPATGRVWHHDRDLSHFFLMTTHTGTHTFYRVGRVNGVMKRIRLGQFPALSVKQARDLCTTINGDIAAGRTVTEARRSTASRKTFADAWSWYLEFHAKPKKRTWERDVSVYRRDLSAPLGSKPLDEITRADVIELVATVTKAKGPGAGNKIIELVRGVYSVAVSNEWATRNPAAKIPKHRGQQRERFLQPSEAPAFFAALAKHSDRIQDFFLLCLWTGARRSNVMAMRWDEIDMTNQVWTIPAEKSKSKRPIALPLSLQAVAIIMARHRDGIGSEWVFPSRASKTGHYVEPKDAWKRIVEAAGLKGITIHDLRRTLGSWQACQGVSLPIIGKTLGHTSAASTAIYARLANDPVRLAIQNAADAIQKASVNKKSEEFPKSETEPS